MSKEELFDLGLTGAIFNCTVIGIGLTKLITDACIENGILFLQLKENGGLILIGDDCTIEKSTTLIGKASYDITNYQNIHIGNITL